MTDDSSAETPVPLGSFVLVRPVAAKEKTTQSGLVVYTESQASKKIFKGRVEGVGNGFAKDRREPISDRIKIGQIVTYPEFAGYDYEQWKFIPEWELLGVVGHD